MKTIYTVKQFYFAKATYNIKQMCYKVKKRRHKLVYLIP